ncbi:MAG TPA: hypothetical protein VLJ10_01285, partial [Candidatus Bathyarchaeia archaeon]|nr:hypothetical protein [Candidatus Bathyarchaeia archaeon]
MKRLIKNKILVNFIIFCVIFSFLGTAILPNSYAQMPGGALTLLGLPGPGTPVALSDAFSPPMMYGLKVFPEEPLRFDFIMDKGDAGLDTAALRAQYAQLMKYFLTALTVPEEDLWVNLSPQEPDRIVPETFGQTEMGRDLLAQDYLLKQLTASLMNPDEEIGKEFWQRVRQEIRAKYGDIDIPVDTFNKVWIVPDEATVYTKNNVAFITGSHLKVMLEQDYFAKQNSRSGERPKGVEPEDYLLTGSHPGAPDPQGPSAPAKVLSGEPGNTSTLLSAGRGTGEQTKEIIREIILPEIEKEVNEGKHFAPLRQVFHAMILATWFKKHLKESFLGKVYVGQKRIAGVDADDKQIKEKIYARYLEAFKTGVYDFIREEYDESTQEVVPHRYFSGGVVMALGNEAAFNAGMDRVYQEDERPPVSNPDLELQMVPARVDPEGVHPARVDLEDPTDTAMLANVDKRKVIQGALKKMLARQMLDGEKIQLQEIFERAGYKKLWDQVLALNGASQRFFLRAYLSGMNLLLEYDEETHQFDSEAHQIEVQAAQRVITLMSQKWITHLMSHFGAATVSGAVTLLEKLGLRLEEGDRIRVEELKRLMDKVTEDNFSVTALLSHFNMSESGTRSMFLLEKIRIFLDESRQLHASVVEFAEKYRSLDPRLETFMKGNYVSEVLFLKQTIDEWEANGGKIAAGAFNPVREVLALSGQFSRNYNIRIKTERSWEIDDLNQKVMGDKLWLYGLLQVLFENAAHAKHSQREPVIELNVNQKDAGDHIVLGLVISDN